MNEDKHTLGEAAHASLVLSYFIGSLLTLMFVWLLPAPNTVIGFYPLVFCAALLWALRQSVSPGTKNIRRDKALKAYANRRVTEMLELSHWARVMASVRAGTPGFRVAREDTAVVLDACGLRVRLCDAGYGFVVISDILVDLPWRVNWRARRAFRAAWPNLMAKPKPVVVEGEKAEALIERAEAERRRLGC